MSPSCYNNSVQNKFVKRIVLFVFSAIWLIGMLAVIIIVDNLLDNTILNIMTFIVLAAIYYPLIRFMRLTDNSE